MNPLRTDRSRHRADAHLRAIVAPGLRVADSPRVPSRAPRRAAVVLSRASRALRNVHRIVRRHLDIIAHRARASVHHARRRRDDE